MRMQAFSYPFIAVITFEIDDGSGKFIDIKGYVVFTYTEQFINQTT